MQPHASADAELIQRAKSGDTHAAAQLYERYRTPIYRYLLAQVRQPEVAEDLLADVFLRMLEGLERYEDRGWPVSAWLYRIARDRMVDAHRRQRRHPSVSLGSVELADDGIEETVSARLECERLTGSLGWLTRDQRQVIALRFLQGLTIQEVAAHTGRTEGAVKSLQHRALATMARQLRVSLAQ